MTTDGKIWDEKLQYDIHREAAKISALSLSKIDKYEYLTGEAACNKWQMLCMHQMDKFLTSHMW